MEPQDAQGKIGPQDGERADFPRLGNRFIVHSEDTGGLISPGGFDRYFVEMAPLLNAEGGPDREAIGKVQARYGLSMDISSIETLTREHGLRA